MNTRRGVVIFRWRTRIVSSHVFTVTGLGARRRLLLYVFTVLGGSVERPLAPIPRLFLPVGQRCRYRLGPADTSPPPVLSRPDRWRHVISNDECHLRLRAHPVHARRSAVAPLHKSRARWPMLP